jgi:nitrate/nitrite-specific signal transduction histidine kinase
MHAAFADVLWIVCGLGIVAALLAMKGAAKDWEAYNQSGLYMESVRAAQELQLSPGALAAERDDEIRQLVEAANHRRARRGEAPRDVDAEIARLSAETVPAPERVVDPELEDEVRALVELRNQRRVRKGLEPLDVAAEMRRELDELDMLRR